MQPLATESGIDFVRRLALRRLRLSLMSRLSQNGSVTRWMTDYLTAELCPALGIAPVFDEITLPIYGVKSNVLLVRPHGAAPFVLRCMADLAEAERLGEIFRLAESRSLSVPRVKFAQVSKQDIRKRGFAVIVEECLEGRHLAPGEASEAQAAGLAETFARLHSVEREAWGPPGDLSRRSYFDRVVMKKIENRLDGVARCDEDFDRRWRAEILKFAKPLGKAWDGGPPFSLTHDKVNTGNVLFADGGRASLLDLESMRYGAPGKDFTALLYYFCAGAEQEERLKRLYFGRLPERHAAHYARFEPLYRVWLHLSRWAAKSHDIEKRRGKGKEDDADFLASRRREREATWKWMGK